MTNAFVTLIYNDDYLDGALVLGHSLKDHSPDTHRAILITSGVSGDAIKSLGSVFNSIIPVSPILSKSPSCPKHLQQVYTKLHVFNLTQFESVVFLDADTFVVKPIDKLFEYAEPLKIAAAPDVGWPDIFNSGVFVAVPNAQHFQDVVSKAKDTKSFDTGDQGFLNEVFAENWTRVPFIYNVTPTTAYQFPTAASRFSKDISVLHFAGWSKPWETETAPSPEISSVYNQWWTVYNKNKVGGESAAAKTISPDPLWWDASKRPPPVNSAPQAAGLVFTNSDNTWDSDSAEVSSPHIVLGESSYTLPFEKHLPKAERYFPEDDE